MSTQVAVSRVQSTASRGSGRPGASASTRYGAPAISSAADGREGAAQPGQGGARPGRVRDRRRLPARAAARAMLNAGTSTKRQPVLDEQRRRELRHGPRDQERVRVRPGPEQVRQRLVPAEAQQGPGDERAAVTRAALARNRSERLGPVRRRPFRAAGPHATARAAESREGRSPRGCNGRAPGAGPAARPAPGRGPACLPAPHPCPRTCPRACRLRARSAAAPPMPVPAPGPPTGRAVPASCPSRSPAVVSGPSPALGGVTVIAPRPLPVRRGPSPRRRRPGPRIISAHQPTRPKTTAVSTVEGPPMSAYRKSTSCQTSSPHATSAQSVPPGSARGEAGPRRPRGARGRARAAPHTRSASQLPARASSPIRPCSLSTSRYMLCGREQRLLAEGGARARRCRCPRRARARRARPGRRGSP